MTELAKTHKRKLILGLIIALLFVGFKMLKSDGKKEPVEPKTETVEEIVERKAQTVKFGEWEPTEYRSVLGQVVSESDVDVKAELNGTIARVNVSVGDKVFAGQALAGYKTSGDPTAINYQSALSSLQTTKLSNENSIKSSAIALENAQKALVQTMAQQDQNFDQSYESLRLEESSVKTLLVSAVDTIDKHVQFTAKYKYNQSLAYFQIGNTDTIRKQRVKTAGQQVKIKVDGLAATTVGANKTQILQAAKVRLELIKELQTIYDDLEVLIERTAINTRISESEANSFLAAVEGVHNALDARVGSYQAKIDQAKGAREGSRLAIINAQNAVESAKSGLELARSSAEAQLIGAQNQVNIAGASTADLTVRAPISGTITARDVRVGDLVNPGTTLFTIVNEAQDKKVVAFLSQDELRQAQKAETIKVEINGEDIAATNVFLSSQLDALTQKVLAEFTIPAGVSLVGNLATVKIPLGSGGEAGSNLLPFSAVSFEPDGPEVLVVNKDRIVERKKVIVDRVVVSNIEIVSGIEAGEEIVEFYKRVFPGEKVVDPNVADPTEEVKDEAVVTSEDVVDETTELEINLDK